MDASHTEHFLSNIQKYVRQEYKEDLVLVKGCTAWIQYFHTLMKEKSLPLMEVQGRLGIKGAQSIIGVAVIEGCHYNSGPIPLLPLNELRICHAFKLIGQKVADASKSL